MPPNFRTPPSSNRWSKTWYRRYGVSDRPMPADYAQFKQYWDRKMDEVVVAHKSARYGVGYVTRGGAYGLGLIRLAAGFYGQPLPMTTEKQPHVTEENRKEAERVMKSYDDTRPTVTLPGTGGTVSGTAVSDWVDDEGNPIYGRSENDTDKDKGEDNGDDG